MVKQYGSTNDATQSSTGHRFTYSTGPERLTTASGKQLDLGTPISLSGAFTAYAVGSRTTGKHWVPFGGSDGTGLFIHSSNTAYVDLIDSLLASTAYTGSAGLILARWRRTAGGVAYFASTGMAEVSLGAYASTLPITRLGGRYDDFTQATESPCDIRGLYIVTADLVATGDDVDLLGYILSTFGVTL